jgi:hypothetical protein
MKQVLGTVLIQNIGVQPYVRPYFNLKQLIAEVSLSDIVCQLNLVVFHFQNRG